MRKRIYIAGPISKGVLADNIKMATDAGIRLMRAGFAPLVPHLTCYMGGSTPEVLPHGTKHEDWLDADLPWVAVSEALLRLPGESTGADREVALARELGIPVFHDLEQLLQHVRPEKPDQGDLRYKKLLDELWMLHCRKAADYGTDEDYLANLRASEAFGIPAWLGGLIRLNDKVKRLQTFAKKRTLANESVQDTLLDLAAYSLLVLILFQEQNGKE